MFKKIEHIGIAVKNLEIANQLFETLSEIGLLKIEKVEREGVLTSFFEINGTKIEFLEAINQESPIAKLRAEFTSMRLLNSAFSSIFTSSACSTADFWVKLSSL